MNRNEHLFQFTAKAISEAPATEAQYHQTRLDWWKIEQGKTTAKAQEAGIEVREFDVTGGKKVEVVIDHTITMRLSECASKIDNHRRWADRFRIEADAYGTQPPGREYDLDPDDVVYFRLAGGARGD